MRILILLIILLLPAIHTAQESTVPPSKKLDKTYKAQLELKQQRSCREFHIDGDYQEFERLRRTIIGVETP